MVLGCTLAVYSQDEAVKGEKMKKGSEIVESARKAIGSEKLFSGLKSLQMRTESTNIQNSRLPGFANSLNILLPDKIKIVSQLNGMNTTTSIWNGSQYKKYSESNIEGQITRRDVTDEGLTNEQLKAISKNAPGMTGEQLKRIQSVRGKSPEDALNQQLWTQLFPIILFNPLNPNVEYEYVGKAEASGKTANIVDVKSKYDRSIRMFFDTETNLLLMMTQKYKGFDGDYEINYYFSNQELAEKVLIPKKIKIENKYTPTGKDTRTTYIDTDVLEFKLNSEFKKDMFEIK